MKGMNSIKNLLGSFSGSSPVIKGVAAAMAVEAANKILAEMFGADIGRHANAAYVKNNVLNIACLSASAAQEIKMRENELVKKTNEAIKFTLVKRVKYLI